MRGTAVVSSAVILLVILLGPAAPAEAQGPATWFTYTHPHLGTTTNGLNQGDARLYGLSMRIDFRRPYSLTLTSDTSFGPISLGTVSTELKSATVHYRFDLPRARLSVFAGYGLADSYRMANDPAALRTSGLLLGADAQVRVGRRGLLDGSVAYGPSWRTVVGSTPAPASRYLDYRLSVSLEVIPNLYGQIGYRGIIQSSVPASFFCATTPCRISWQGPYIGLLFRI